MSYTTLEKPDGTVVKVADHLVKKAIEKGYRAPGTSPKQAAKDVISYERKRQQSPLESFGHGFTEGASMGWGDELAGMIGGDFARESMRAKQAAAKEQSPYISGAGDVLGNLATTFIPGGLAAKTLGASARAGAVLGQGALEGLGRAQDKTVGSAALGAAASGAGYGIGKGISSALKFFRPSNLSDIAETQAVRSTNAKLKDLRDLGKNPNEFGRELLDEGLVKFGMTSDDVMKRAADQASATGKIIGSYDDKFLKDQTTIGKSRLSKQLGSLSSEYKKMAKKDPIAEDIVAKYSEIIPRYQEKLFNNPKVTISDLTLMKRNLNDLYDKSAKEMTKLDNQVKKGIRSKLKSEESRSIGEKYGDSVLTDWEKANKRYGIATDALGITEDDALRQLANRKISPSDYIMTAAGIASQRPESGLLLGALNWIGRNYGNSTIASAANSLAKAMKKTPEKVQEFLPKLGRVINDPSKFAAAHTVLMMTEPKYRSLIEENKL